MKRLITNSFHNNVTPDCPTLIDVNWLHHTLTFKVSKQEGVWMPMLFQEVFPETKMPNGTRMVTCEIKSIDQVNKCRIFLVKAYDAIEAMNPVSRRLYSTTNIMLREYTVNNLNEIAKRLENNQKPGEEQVVTMRLLPKLNQFE